MINKIKILTQELNKASFDYYKYGTSDLSDPEFDYKIDELKKLEEETGFKMSNSPVNKVGYNVITEQNKVQHKVPMLSLEKVHIAKEIIDFSEGKDLIAMFKMDGISLRATYDKNGDIVGLSSRGNGTVGTDLFYQRFSFENLPLHIDVDEETIFDGEAIITDSDFEEINSKLSEENKYSHSRNLAAGSLALLDTSISSKRHLKFIVWDVIQSSCESNNFNERLKFAEKKGFDIVDYYLTSTYIDEDLINIINNRLMDEAKELGYKIDGVVWKYNSIRYGKSKGKTEHHFCNAVAYKAENKVYETVLENIEWQVSKSGLINPVAIFKEVDLDGAKTTKATLHNLNYIKNLQLGYGDCIGVIRSNEVIPRVVDNYTRSNTWTYAKTCPVCGHPTEIIISSSGTETLMCPNENCEGKLLGKLELFVSKEGLDIDGLSTSTLETFINHGYLHNAADIYNLKDHAKEIMKLDGFGKRSVEKLLSAIEDSRQTTLSNFLRSLGINMIGKSASKDLAKFCNNDIKTFNQYIVNHTDFSTKIDGFGEKMNKSLHDWFKKEENRALYKAICKEIVFKVEDKKTGTDENYKDLSGMVFVITGSLNHFKSRDELKVLLESRNAKVSGSVSSKTTALVCNEDSNSSKSKKAKELGIPIWTEDDLLNYIKI